MSDIPVTVAVEDAQYTQFEADLGVLLNSHNMERMSNTPDFILARYLVACLRSFNYGTGERELWYGHSHEPGSRPPVPDAAWDGSA